MTTISIRLPNSLHAAARELAKQDGSSINHIITLALAEKVAALTTETYLQRRAMQGSAAKFHAALANVADEPPAEEDAL